ncbi:MAG TPA: efflux RND transporter periplasmic adaptor subunit [Bauldia sp.]|nr:efflux RND transporter periplasmic adaptor subunit [Bauldia sp.]
MASRIFRPSHILAVALVAGAGFWILSGQVGSPAGETAPAAPAGPAAPAPVPVQKVSVATATPEQHNRSVILSCFTQSDRRSIAVARTGGVIIDLRVRRGSRVSSGDIVAVLSDEGRSSAVAQAAALVDQRQAEYDSNKRLIDRGDQPRNNLPALEAGVAAAKAALAAAEAEAEKSNIRSPVAGIVDTVPVEVGSAIQPGTEIATIVGPDPMLAVGAVSERQRGLLQTGQAAKVRFIDGATFDGTVSFVSLSAEKATRTYRVEARIANPLAKIADGVTCEMAVTLAPMEAAAVPRSALVFSDRGELGVRVADEKNLARFVPISIVDDERDSVWVTGIDKPMRVIVVGQDFVKDGDPVEAVSAAEAATGMEPPA